MVRRYTPLNQRQHDVLKWVKDGCPEGVWTDFTFKQTTYALAGRRLVTVDRRRGSWSARITDDGRYYLEHGSYKEQASLTSAPSHTPSLAPARAKQDSPALSVSPADLVAELRQAGSPLTLEDPSPGLRAAYRSAIHQAINGGLVPDGYALRHAGRDKGDLVIRLVSLDDLPQPIEPLPPVPIPDTLQPSHPAVRMLLDHQNMLDVSAQIRQRALLLIQAIADECARRGYEMSSKEDADATFWIGIGVDQFAFTLSEELERREVLDDERLSEVKYSWQRVPLTVRDVHSGRLVLRLCGGHPPEFWADRKRGALDDKLPAVFKEIDARATARVEARTAAEARRVALVKQWEEAIPRARQAYLDELNRERLSRHVTASTEAAAIRAYCDRLEEMLGQILDGPQRTAVVEWIAWARAEADRVDPLRDLESLKYHVPDEIRPSELDRFMPKGLNARRPPD